MTIDIPTHDEPKVIESSGNEFADLGLPGPEMALAKAKLAIAIAGAIETQGLTQEDAGRITGLDQPRISDIMRGRSSGLSIDRIFRALNTLCGIRLNATRYDAVDPLHPNVETLG